MKTVQNKLAQLKKGTSSNLKSTMEITINEKTLKISYDLKVHNGRGSKGFTRNLKLGMKMIT